jgi:hypothetical protein
MCHRAVHINAAVTAGCELGPCLTPHFDDKKSNEPRIAIEFHDMAD